MSRSNLKLAARRSLLALIGTAALAAVSATPMLAQDPANQPETTPQQQGPGRHGGETQERQLEHMTKALNLTPDQVTQVKAIQEDSRQQMMAVHQDSSVAGPDKRARMMSIRQAQETKVRALLNDGQKAKYDQMLAKMHERREEHRDQGQGGNQPTPPPPSA